MDPRQSVDEKYYEVITAGGIAEGFFIRAREAVYRDFLRLTRARAGLPILDVGISDVLSPAANVLERKYPHQADITACGIGGAADFVAAFPLLRYVQIEPNKSLPFANDSFAIATANAVLEHVGSPQKQRTFIAELARIAPRVFVTVPNRYFPIEHHTAIPILHYFDGSFAIACRLLGKQPWARAENLILMSAGALRSLVPQGCRATIGVTGLNLGPLSSNLYLYLERS